MANRAITYSEYKKAIADGEELPNGTRIIDLPDTVHLWFGLTYAHYFVSHLSSLQAMPVEWQLQFFQVINELTQSFDWQPEAGLRYRITLHEFDGDEIGKQVKDPLLGRSLCDRSVLTSEMLPLQRGNYLVLPRVLMEAVDEEWQHKTVQQLKQLDQTDWLPEGDCIYQISLVNRSGSLYTDPLLNYRHPNYAELERQRRAK